ncbi:hypothetical protein [Neorhizobium galegae]|uniref:hypothetical protein n=1 Tax=Neorhizobium galegae TaxID=399 RepID=UPI001F31D32E|nr:hypothetical protein [Neorhizobium galegae]UIK04106.1 hypothetical protein LZK81_15585 [Neorhizobium galegae]
MRRFSRPIGIALGLAALLLSDARAEPVSVRSRNGEIGQAWLFGSAGINPGECWLAVPAHVVASPETKELQPFFFTDRNAVGGESARPVSGAIDAPKTPMEERAADLAFARVASGRKDGACLSRLGPPTFVYNNLLASAPRMNVFSMLRTSYGNFEVALKRGGVDEFGGAILQFQVPDPADKSFLQKGLSGAIVMSERSGSPVPFAMITRVPADQSGVMAIRFDYIRERFAAIDSHDSAKRRGSRAAGDGVPYTVLGYTALLLKGSDGPSALQSGSGCFRAAADGGRSDIELMIELADKLDRIETIELQHQGSCAGTPKTFWVEERRPGDGAWNYVGKCQTGSAGAPPCRVNLNGPRQLRLRIEAKEPVSLSGMKLR